MFRYKIFYFFFGLLLFFSCSERKIIDSPLCQLRVEVRAVHGVPFLEVYTKEGICVVSVRLGMNTSEGDFYEKVKIESQPRVDSMYVSYEIPVGKQKSVSLFQNEAIFSLVNSEGYRLQVEVRVNECGVAFRYRMPGKRNIEVMKDWTAFTFSENSEGYFLPMLNSRQVDGALMPGYEASYEMGVPLTQESKEHCGWCYPALVKTDCGSEKNYWVLISETGVRKNYCGTHLAEGDSVGCLRIAYPEKIVKGIQEADYPVFNNATPWHVLVVSMGLKDIVENTWMTDVVVEEFEPTVKYIPGRATWSWLTKDDDVTSLEEQKRFIDLAESLNFEYCLVDAGWDVSLGKKKIEELARYAKTKNIGLWLWYNGDMESEKEGKLPNSYLKIRESRLEEMAWLQEIGVKGMKINFSGRENQNALSFYEELLRDANDFGLAVNLHGTILPRGWERMFPNLMTAEALQGMEQSMRSQELENMRSKHIAVLVFTRNTVAPADFTPIVLSEELGLSNGKRVMRSTTLAFELALPILLHSGIQHYGMIPEDLQRYPSFIFKYLSEVPASWDEIRLLAGFPGEYVVLARRLGTRWFLAGINAQKEPLELDVDLSFMGKKSLNKITSTSKNELMYEVVDGRRSVHLRIEENDGVIFY